MKEQILQVFPSVLRLHGGELLIDVDWLDALDIYLKNFDKVVLACRASTTDPDFSLQNCRPVKDLPYGETLEFLPLPDAFKLKDFIKSYAHVRALLHQKIQESKYLEFSPHALVGDWAGVACLEAIRQNRPYVISADVVYHQVARVKYNQKSLIKRLIKEAISLPLMQSYHRHFLRNSSMALIQGQDTYNAYAPFCRKANLIHHVTVTDQERITPEALQHKTAEVLAKGSPLKICYAGRANKLKGAMEWVQVIDALVKLGTNVQATWLGDGPLLDNMQALATELGIADYIQFPGFISDRPTLLALIQESHIFLFCHRTPESPRCLIEAITLGCALVGYQSAYPAGLVGDYGGGCFAEIGNWQELASIVASLSESRQALVTLMQNAAQSGGLFERDKAHQRRVDLIKSAYRDLDDSSETFDWALRSGTHCS